MTCAIKKLSISEGFTFRSLCIISVKSQIVKDL